MELLVSLLSDPHDDTEHSPEEWARSGLDTVSILYIYICAALTHDWHWSTSGFGLERGDNHLT